MKKWFNMNMLYIYIKYGTSNITNYRLDSIS